MIFDVCVCTYGCTKFWFNAWLEERLMTHHKLIPVCIWGLLVYIWGERPKKLHMGSPRMHNKIVRIWGVTYMWAHLLLWTWSFLDVLFWHLLAGDVATSVHGVRRLLAELAAMADQAPLATSNSVAIAEEYCGWCHLAILGSALSPSLQIPDGFRIPAGSGTN